MSTDQSSPDPRAEEIYFKALEIRDATERATFVRGACASDQKLRNEVDGLIQNDPGTFSDEIPSSTRAGAKPPESVPKKVGDIIDGYELTEELGSGTFGTVWCVSKLGFGKEFALKIINPNMATNSLIERFKAESEALKKLDHPYIAAITDAGWTKEARPYFVMRLVRGKPVTLYADEQRLTIHERLELFTKLCRAIQFAHVNHIIHRDIKPSNILVTPLGSEHWPTVIDFGIAKSVTVTTMPERGPSTVTGEVLGTWEYMSPEQVRGQPIDARTDVYSLGIVLYELLLGCRPLDMDGLDNYERWKRIIENKPARPQFRLSNMGYNEQQTVAASRNTDHNHLCESFGGPLDDIVMKCLEKDRQRRFPTVRDLEIAIEGFLKTEQEAAWKNKTTTLPDPWRDRLKALGKTVFDPIWSSDSLWISDSDRATIGKSKWYQTVPGFGAKAMLLLLFFDCVYSWARLDVIGGLCCMVLIAGVAYIASLVRKFRKPKPIIPPEPVVVSERPMTKKEVLVVTVFISIYLVIILLFIMRPFVGCMSLVGIGLVMRMLGRRKPSVK